MAHKTKKKMENKNFRKDPIPYSRYEKTKKEEIRAKQKKHKNNGDVNMEDN